MPFDQSIVPTFETVWSVMTASWPLPDHQEQELRPLTRWLRERGARVSGPAFSGALVAMRQAAAGALAALAEFDAVLTPTVAQLPALVGEIRDDDDPAQDFENQKAFTPFTAAWNVTGMPAVSLPTGWSETGLPIGTMLAGKPGSRPCAVRVGRPGGGLDRARGRAAGRAPRCRTGLRTHSRHCGGRRPWWACGLASVTVTSGPVPGGRW